MNRKQRALEEYQQMDAKDKHLVQLVLGTMIWLVLITISMLGCVSLYLLLR